MRPDARQQVLFADQIAGSLNQNRQNIKGASANADLCFVTHQQLALRLKKEPVENKRTGNPVG